MSRVFRYSVPFASRARLGLAELRAELAKTRAQLAELRTEFAELRDWLAGIRGRQPASTMEASALEETGIPSLKPLVVDDAASRAFESLTKRQREILKHIANGENTKQIAGVLKLSPKTIEYHRLKLMAALNVHDIPGLVRFAMRIGLISPHD